MHLVLILIIYLVYAVRCLEIRGDRYSGAVNTSLILDFGWYTCRLSVIRHRSVIGTVR